LCGEVPLILLADAAGWCSDRLPIPKTLRNRKGPLATELV
jgi:hypothetical protein